MEKLKLKTSYGGEYPVFFRTSRYADNDNLYVGIWAEIDGFHEPWSDLTVNLEKKCDENCAFIDINNNDPSIIEWLISNSLGEPTGEWEISGFCAYPEFRFNMDELIKYVRPFSADGEDETEEPTDEYCVDESSGKLARYFVYDAEDDCVSDGYRYEDDAIAYAKENNHPVVKIHRYFYDESNNIISDGVPQEIWHA